MIDRILLMGILVGAALLLFFWKADDDTLNKIRERMGISITSSEGQVTSTGIVDGQKDEKDE